MDPEQTLREEIWRQLQLAVTDREHAWRTPVLASADTRGAPQARTVVLREADADGQRLVFFTDHRSPKVVEFAAQPAGMLVFWSRALSWQLRVAVDIRIETGGEQVAAAWEQIRSTAAAADYLSLQAPGSPLQGNSRDSAEQHALGIIRAAVRSIDWLELSARGHRRALLTGAGVQWLVP